MNFHYLVYIYINIYILTDVFGTFLLAMQVSYYTTFFVLCIWNTCRTWSWVCLAQIYICIYSTGLNIFMCICLCNLYLLFLCSLFIHLVAYQFCLLTLFAYIENASHIFISYKNFLQSVIVMSFLLESLVGFLLAWGCLDSTIFLIN